MSDCIFSVLKQLQIDMASPDGPVAVEIEGTRRKRLEEQVGDSLLCAICLCLFEDPRMLSCNHSYCRRCLEVALVNRVWDPDKPVGDDEIGCPRCRRITKLGVGGVSQLAVNYDLRNVVDSFREPEVDLFSPVHSPQPFPSLSRPTPAALLCEQHNRELEFFCNETDELVCAMCLVHTHHQRHQHFAVTDVLPQQLEQLRNTYFEMVEKEFVNASIAVNEIDFEIESLKERKESIQQHIQERFCMMHEALRQREQKLISVTERVTAKKVSRLERQGNSMRETKQELERHKVHLQRILERPHDFSFLKDKKKLTDGIMEAIRKAKTRDRKPVESVKDGPEYFLPDNMLHSAKEYGEVFCKPCPSMFRASGEGLKKAFVETEAKFSVFARDQYGMRSCVGGNAIEVLIEGPELGTMLPFRVTQHEKGEYRVMYTPQAVGLHSITIRVDGHAIENSQASVTVFKNRDYFTMKSPKYTITKQQVQAQPEVSTMASVCILPDGAIVFTDALCLRVVTQSGEYVRTIGSYGNGPGQFLQPFGIAANKHGHIFVSDCSSHRILKFNTEGKFLQQHGTYGNRNGMFAYPEGIALGEDKLYVADRENHRIQVFTQKDIKKCVAVFGKKGLDPGQFISPRDVAVDSPRKRLFVSDDTNNRIQALTLDGKPLAQFGNGGVVSLNTPYFLAVDQDGFVLATEAKSNSIAILTPQGKVICRLGNHGDDPGQFRSPYGICVDSHRRIIVTDRTNHCIQIF